MDARQKALLDSRLDTALEEDYGGVTRKDASLIVSIGCSCALHLVVLFAPVFGTIAGFVESEARYSQKPPSSLAVTLSAYRPDRAQDWPPPLEAPKQPELPRPEQRPVTDDRPNPAGSRMDDADLMPLPGIIYYPTTFLTLRPQPLNEVDLDPPHIRRIVASGKVILRIWINPFGQTAKVIVEASNLPRDFVDTASGAFELLRFTPGELHGQKVGVFMRIEVSYDDGRIIKTEILAPDAVSPE